VKLRRIRQIDCLTRLQRFGNAAARDPSAASRIITVWRWCGSPARIDVYSIRTRLLNGEDPIRRVDFNGLARKGFDRR